MTNSDNIPGLVRSYEDGVYTFEELAAKFLALSDDVEIDAIMAQVPQPLAQRFIEWARKLYDNDVPAQDFVDVHSEATMPEARLASIRAWLKRQL